MNAKSTSKAKPAKSDALRTEYRREDLGAGVRGKYYAQYLAGTNLVLLAPDVAEVFNSPQSVNDALRSLIDVAQRSTHVTARPGRPRKTARTSAKHP